MYSRRALSAFFTDQEALAGGEFNKFFPQSRDQFDIVYTQEKQGFAEAILRADGDDVATLAIFDTVSNPDAAAKYADSTEKTTNYYEHTGTQTLARRLIEQAVNEI